MKRISAIAAMLALCLGLSSHAALAAVPGDACSPNGVAGVNGVMQMTCTSGVWVLNALKLGNSSVTCNSSNAGYIRWNGSAFQGCDGTSWKYLNGRQISGIPFTTLNALASGCTEAAVAACNMSGSCWVLMICNSACSRHCINNSHNGGGLMTEVSGANAACSCF